MVSMGELPKADAMTQEEFEKRQKGLLKGGTGPVPPGKPDPDRPYDYYSGYDSKGDSFKLPAPAGPYDPTKPDSALLRAEAAYDEDKLLEKAAAHCDTLSARLDACEEKMVARAGEQDD